MALLKLIMTICFQGYCMDVNVKRILPNRAIDFSTTHESSRSEIFLRLIQIIEQRQC